MSKPIYTHEELLADHEYASPHMAAGQRLHGGFLADGTYQPPRAKNREPALDAWESALADRGGAPFGASADLLSGVRMPNPEQQLALLRNGMDRFFWNNLTIIGKIEAKGRFLSELPIPDLQPAIVEDISGMAIGHLHKGLLHAHGLDEGGEPAKGIGGHDAMWFAARDLVFGPDAFPDVEPQPSIGREETGQRYLPEIDAGVEGLFSFLANLLIIEFRAELGFADSQRLLRTSDLFVGKRYEAEEAAELIERIRTDELIHVRSLNLYLGELRSITLRTTSGGTVPGAELIDRFWEGMVHWATVEQPRLSAERQREYLRELITQHDASGQLWDTFQRAA